MLMISLKSTVHILLIIRACFSQFGAFNYLFLSNNKSVGGFTGFIILLSVSSGCSNKKEAGESVDPPASFFI